MSMRPRPRPQPQPQPLTTSSMLIHADTDAQPSQVSASAPSSATASPSPTVSADDSPPSGLVSTSVSTLDPDEYVAGQAPPPAAAMKSKAGPRDASPNAGSGVSTMKSHPAARRSSPSAGFDAAAGSRRASGRVRKPTAKLQALNGSPYNSPPLADTIIIGSSSTADDEPVVKAKNATATDEDPTVKADTAGEAHQPATTENNTVLGPTSPPPPAPPNSHGLHESDGSTDSTGQVNGIPTNESLAQVNGTTTPPTVTLKFTRTPTPDAAPAESAQDGSVGPSGPSPSRRVSRRERKPTAKFLSTSPTAQKRAATDSVEEPPRKSARISSSSARVPSKLRHSISSTPAAPEERPDVPSRATPSPATPTPPAPVSTTTTPSKIIIIKCSRLSEALTRSPAAAIEASPSPVATLSRTRSGRHASGKDKADSTPVEKTPGPQVAFPGTASCGLSCLPPSSRLLAMAEIVKQMPDRQKRGKTAPGSAHDWHVYTKRWCRCDAIQALPLERTDSSELAKALLPNPLSDGTKTDTVDLTDPAPTPNELALLSAPVNTIVRAEVGERLSGLFSGPSATGNLSASPVLNHAQSSHALDMSPPPLRGPLKRRVTIQEAPNSSLPASNPNKRSYDERIREDHLALSDIRKRAAAQGILWSFNMTYDDIQSLLADRAKGPPTTQRLSVPYSPHHAPPDGGRRLPPSPGTDMQALGQHHLNGKPPQADLWEQHYLTVIEEKPWQAKAPVETTRKRPRTSDDDDMATLQFRRHSSPARPKSSRFRVDPRGLRGESPGPGTIINMETAHAGSARSSRRSRVARRESTEFN